MKKVSLLLSLLLPLSALAQFNNKGEPSQESLNKERANVAQMQRDANVTLMSRLLISPLPAGCQLLGLIEGNEIGVTAEDYSGPAKIVDLLIQGQRRLIYIPMNAESRHTSMVERFTVPDQRGLLSVESQHRPEDTPVQDIVDGFLSRPVKNRKLDQLLIKYDDQGRVHSIHYGASSKTEVNEAGDKSTSLQGVDCSVEDSN